MRIRGASLIEVMLAVVVTAVTALGLIASQLWMTREARAAAQREHAAWLADAAAESARASASDAALPVLNARAAGLLPKGEIAFVAVGAGVEAARATWSASSRPPASTEYIDKPDACGVAGVPAGVACVALAFAR